MTSTVNGPQPTARRSARPAVDHVLLTRFNLPSAGAESLIRAQDGWLQSRLELFEAHTVPSVRQQSVKAFRWIVYLDPESPQWLIDRLEPLIAEGVFTPIYRESVDWHDVAGDSRTITGATGDLLLSTNLDNDDAVAVDFVERLQAACRPHVREALYIGAGLVRLGGKVYLHHDGDNAFCSVSEPWAAPLTAWRDWHVMLSRHMPSRVIGGPPGWTQIIHGRNVSNRVRGRLIDPSRYARLFPGQLEFATPTTSSLLLDRCVLAPSRAVRDTARHAAKAVVLRVGGKNGLDQLKNRLADTAATRSRAGR